MHCIRQYILDTYPHLPNLLLTAGPTGTAACGIFGVTLHSMFNLPIATKRGSDPAPPLQGASLANLQTKMEGCKILVIDEFSMISGRLIYMICRRCQEAFPQYAMYYFGNLIIILLGKLCVFILHLEYFYFIVHALIAGDPAQLPPVKAKSMMSVSFLLLRLF